MIFTPDGRDWDASSWVFYWTIATLAAHVSDPALGAQLSQIEEHHLGALDVGDLPESQRRDLVTVIRELPAIASSKLPQTDGRPFVISQLEELAALFSPA
jgi:hypothetical protein